MAGFSESGKGQDKSCHPFPLEQRQQANARCSINGRAFCASWGRAVPLDAIPLSLFLSSRLFPLAFRIPDDPEQSGMSRYRLMAPWSRLPKKARPIEYHAINRQWRDDGTNDTEAPGRIPNILATFKGDWHSMEETGASWKTAA
jgi:hypothetical protein